MGEYNVLNLKVRKNQLIKQTCMSVSHAKWNQMLEMTPDGPDSQYIKHSP